MSSSLGPIYIQTFPAKVDEEVSLHIDQVLLLMPFFRLNAGGTGYIDATGDYDLCMNLDGTKYYFTNKTLSDAVFGYRYVPVATKSRKGGV